MKVFIVALLTLTVISCGRRRQPQATNDPVFYVDYQLDLRQDFIYVKSDGFIFVVEYGKLEEFLLGDNI